MVMSLMVVAPLAFTTVIKVLRGLVEGELTGQYAQ